MTVPSQDVADRRAAAAPRARGSAGGRRDAALRHGAARVRSAPGGVRTTGCPREPDVMAGPTPEPSRPRGAPTTTSRSMRSPSSMIGKNRPAPRPCTTRSTTSRTGSPDRPPARMAGVHRLNATADIIRCPCRSSSRPAEIRIVPKDRKHPERVHADVSSPTEKAEPMSGSATLTVVAASSATKAPTKTADNVGKAWEARNRSSSGSAARRGGRPSVRSAPSWASPRRSDRRRVVCWCTVWV